MDMDDEQLLRAYVAERSEDAFRELVRRHIAVVYGVARRQPGIDAHLADDVAQRVFIALAAKAAGVRGPATLVGWLYLAARHEAQRVVRDEARRRQRETKAATMNETQTGETSAGTAWEELQPVLDAAMAQLGERDRAAVLLRFFSGHSYAEVGRQFAIGEEAARKRVDRALERLRGLLGERGVASTSAALGSALAAHAAPAVAPGTTAAIAQVAWQQASTHGAVSFGLYMSSTKVAAALAGAVLLAAGTLAWHDYVGIERVRAQGAAARSELAALAPQRADSERQLAAIREEIAAAAARAPAPSAATPAPAAARAYLQDPEYRAAASAASEARRHLEFQRLYRQLGLGPDQIARFEAIMVRQDQANLDAQLAREQGRDPQEVFRRSGPEWSAAMRELLGEDGFKQLQVYLRGAALRNFVDGIAARSYDSGEPISLAQADRVLDLALAHDSTFQSGKGTDPAKVDWNAVWDPAGTFLSPAQLATLETAVEVWSLQRRISLGKKPSVP